MLDYLIRRVLYAVPILLGVNLLTFALFFMVNTPDDMARIHLGAKHVTATAIARWKSAHGYDKPLFINAQAVGIGKATDTLFVDKSLRLFALDFGAADDGRDIAREIGSRMGPSLTIALPTFAVGLLFYVSFALLLVFFRGTNLDAGGVVLCVALMSISGLFYVIAGQYSWAWWAAPATPPVSTAPCSSRRSPRITCAARVPRGSRSCACCSAMFWAMP